VKSKHFETLIRNISEKLRIILQSANCTQNARVTLALLRDVLEHSMQLWTLGVLHI
jgi:hypothetical protein